LLTLVTRRVVRAGAAHLRSIPGSPPSPSRRLYAFVEALHLPAMAAIGAAGFKQAAEGRLPALIYFLPRWALLLSHHLSA